jgi:peptidoglycan/LPS O-acetylase OafA/YrhL
MSERYIKSLDGIRALAVLLIMVYHANLLHFSWVAVQLFFVLSGFLITGILWNEKQKPSSIGFKYKKFIVRRSLRIFPLYFGYLLIIGVAYLVLGFPSYYPLNIPYLATYTFNFTRLMPQWQGNPLFTHLWTLSVEEQFYLFFPFIIFFLPKRFVGPVLIFLVFLSPVCRFFLGEWYKANGHEEAAVADAVYWNTLSHLDAFCLGGIVPVLNLAIRIVRPIRLMTGFILIAFIAGALSYYYSPSPYPYWNDLGYHHFLTGNYQHVWHYSIINLICASLIIFLVSPYTKKSLPLLRKLFESKWMVSIGRVSYGMYVFHWLVLIYLYQRYLMPENVLWRVLLFIPYAATVYGLAAISFHYYEKKFIDLKDKFFQRDNSKSIELKHPDL